MALSDYAHWNEEAAQVWWLEEGRHESNEESYDEDWDGLDGDWEDCSDWDDDEPEAIEPEAWYGEDLGCPSELA